MDFGKKRATGSTSWMSTPFTSPGKGYERKSSSKRRVAENMFTPPRGGKGDSVSAFAFDDVLSPLNENGRSAVAGMKKTRKAGHRTGLTPQRRTAPHISPPKDIVFSSDEEDDTPVKRAPRHGGRRASQRSARRPSEGKSESKVGHALPAKSPAAAFRRPLDAKPVHSPGDFKEEYYNRFRAAEVSPVIPAGKRRKARTKGKSRLAQYYIVRERSGMKRMFPNFLLYRENMDGHVPQLVMIARRQRACRSVNYHLFSVDGGVPAKGLTKDSAEYLGKLRADGGKSTEFTLYGRADEDVKPQLAAIKFVSTGDYARPRQLQVLLPPHDTEWTKQSPTEGLLHRLNTQRCDGLLYIQSKLPVIVGDAYRLDFEGRVKVASIKNSQLEFIPDTTDRGHPHKVLQFGKVEDDRFVLDFCEPLSPMQAFAYGIVQFTA